MADTSTFTVPGLTLDDGHRVGEALQLRLHALNDLQLTLKHVHWNVVGPHFIGVHEMLDPQIEAVRGMVDATAERMATLGVAPVGTPGHLVAHRTWDDYALLRDDTTAHLAALDLVYTGLIEDHRADIELTDDLDLVTQDMLIAQVAQLELFQWFIRAHLESTSGALSNAGARRESVAARAATRTAAASGGVAAGATTKRAASKTARKTARKTAKKAAR
ncbi:MAG TPA: DNA starvation/stationary phase protection protein [Humibacillus sp.]|nr:DNA starvation/stationary phase protection protein [Humibacillus sp.]